MKPYQFFKICKHFNKEREKNTYAAVNEKKTAKRKRQIARNGKLRYLFQKWIQSFSNEHNTNKCFYGQHVHICRLIKVNLALPLAF